MIDLAMEDFKARLLKTVEKYIEDYLATHLMSLMQMVKDLHSRLEVDRAQQDHTLKPKKDDLLSSLITPRDPLDQDEFKVISFPQSPECFSDGFLIPSLPGTNQETNKLTAFDDHFSSIEKIVSSKEARELDQSPLLSQPKAQQPARPLSRSSSSSDAEDLTATRANK